VARAERVFDVQCDGPYVYWLEHGQDTHLFRAPLSGGTVESVTDQAAKAFALNGDYVYFSANLPTGDAVGAAIFRQRKDGHVADVIFQDPNARWAPAIGVDATHVYFANDADQIESVENDGKGKPKRVTRTEGGVNALLVGASEVVWLTNSGDLVKAEKTGGEPALLHRRGTHASVVAVAVDGSTVYVCTIVGLDWLWGGALVRYGPNDGPDGSPLRFGNCRALAVDENRVYAAQGASYAHSRDVVSVPK
jgi:hypothetical protein